MAAGLEPVPSFSGFSPSDYIISPEQLPLDLQTVPDVEQTVDMLGNASWREAGAFFSRALGFPVVPVQGGFEAEQIFYLLKKVKQAGKKIIGFDLNEVGVSQNEWDENVGARILYKLCSLLTVTNTV